MVKKRSLVVIIVCLAALALGGCVPDRYLRFVNEDLPEGWGMYLLIEPQAGDEVTEAEDDDLKNSEIGQYDEDGCYISERIEGMDTFHRADMTTLHFRSRYMMEEFCKKYRKVRIAITDDKGRVLRVSDDYDILCRDKYAIVVTTEVDTQTAELKCKALERRHIFGEYDDFLMVVLWVGAIASGIVLTAVMIVCLAVKNKPSRIVAAIAFVLMSICSVLLTTWQLIYCLVPYYDINDKGLTEFVLRDIFTENISWLVGTLLFGIFMATARSAKTEVR